MEDRMRILILRKLTTTFVVSTMFSLLLVLIYGISDGFEFVYNQGNQFIGWFYIYLMYIGVVVLVYGNLVSVIIELQTEWFQQNSWLYVFVLGIFGLVNGVFFKKEHLPYSECWLQLFMELLISGYIKELKRIRVSKCFFFYLSFC